MSDKPLDEMIGAVQFSPPWSPQALAGLSKTVTEINKPYRDQRQIEVAQTLFEWWWRVGTPQVPHDPSWDECLDHIQAFWMDGAWQVLKK